jgi:hypothetical protein
LDISVAADGALSQATYFQVWWARAVIARLWGCREGASRGQVDEPNKITSNKRGNNSRLQMLDPKNSRQDLLLVSPQYQLIAFPAACGSVAAAGRATAARQPTMQLMAAAAL